MGGYTCGVVISLIKSLYIDYHNTVAMCFLPSSTSLNGTFAHEYQQCSGTGLLVLVFSSISIQKTHLDLKRNTRKHLLVQYREEKQDGYLLSQESVVAGRK